jgi:hypothetical protein
MPPTSVLTMYHGGHLAIPSEATWLSDFDYAAAWAELVDADYVWEVTLGFAPHEILDVTRCGFDAEAVAEALRAMNVQALDPPADQPGFPPAVIRATSASAIREAGYRAIRLREWVDWDLGAGRQETVSLYLADLSAIVVTRKAPLPSEWSFQRHGRRPSPHILRSLSRLRTSVQETQALGSWA